PRFFGPDVPNAVWSVRPAHSRTRSDSTWQPYQSAEKAMTRRQPTISVHPPRPILAAPSFPIVESKLTPAPTRPGLVSRVRLLDWLGASAATPVVAGCAAGRDRDTR